MKRRLFIAPLVLALVATAGCANLSELQFRQDHRLEIVEPEARSSIRLPVTVRWEARDIATFDAGNQQDGARFGVFVDRSPVPPGERLDWVVRNDRDCAQIPSCPDEAYLAARGVMSTSETSVVLERIPRTGQEGRERHEVTVVLLDDSGRREGETASYVTFDLVRDS